jgi:hypothetical protein
MTNTFSWQAGQQVTGNYYGVSFTGTIDEGTRPNTANWQEMIIFITLDNPITVLGATRDDVCIYVGKDGTSDMGRVSLS